MSNNTKTILPRLPVVGGLAALAFLLFVPDTAQAQGTVLFACFVPNSGVVYRVNPPGSPGESPDLKDACTGKKHVEFSWNAQGPAGPEGPPGISGFEKVIRFFERLRVNNNVNIETFSAPCPAGKEILGGGYAIEPIVLPGPPLASRPSASAGWEVTLEWNFSFPGQTLEVTVYALCAIAA